MFRNRRLCNAQTLRQRSVSKRLLPIEGADRSAHISRILRCARCFQRVLLPHAASSTCSSATPSSSLPFFAGLVRPLQKMDHDGACDEIWRALSPELMLRVLSARPPHTLAYAGRLACKDAAQQCTQPQQCTLLLSEPLPPSSQAFDLALAKAQQGVSALSFRRQLNLFSTAAASGSQANLELVWTVMRPRVCPEMLRVGPPKDVRDVGDPGVAAARAGHPHLLPWLLAHCPGLVDPVKALAAVAGHCDLAALQEAWGLVREALDSPGEGGARQQPGRTTRADGVGEQGGSMWEQLLDAAAACKFPEGSAKLEWVLWAGGGCSLVRAATVAAALRSGQLDRVQWLLREFPWVRVGPGKGGIVTAALQHSDLGVVEWLVDEAACALPGAEEGAEAAAASGNVAKLLWLERRGLPLTSAAWNLAARCAARKGHVGVLRFLEERPVDFSDPTDGGLFYAAVESGSIEAAALLRHHGCPANYDLCFAARGNVEMVRWLLDEAQLNTSPEAALQGVLYLWPDQTSADDAGLAAAVGMLLEVAKAAGGAAGKAGDAIKTEVLFAVNAAASRGNAQLLRTILEHPLAPYAHDVYMGEAASSGCVDAMRWLSQPGESSGRRRYTEPARSVAWLSCHGALVSGDLATAAYLTSLGMVWGRTSLFQAVAKGCFLSGLQWMVEQGAPAGPKGVRRALEGAKSTEVREWLVSLLPCGAVRKEAMRFVLPCTTSGRLSRRNSF